METPEKGEFVSSVPGILQLEEYEIVEELV
jgi:hypothetical protein